MWICPLLEPPTPGAYMYFLLKLSSLPELAGNASCRVYAPGINIQSFFTAETWARASNHAQLSSWHCFPGVCISSFIINTTSQGKATSLGNVIGITTAFQL